MASAAEQLARNLNLHSPRRRSAATCYPGALLVYRGTLRCPASTPTPRDLEPPQGIAGMFCLFAGGAHRSDIRLNLIPYITAQCRAGHSTASPRLEALEEEGGRQMNQYTRYWRCSVPSALRRCRSQTARRRSIRAGSSAVDRITGRRYDVPDVAKEQSSRVGNGISLIILRASSPISRRRSSSSL